MAIMHKVDALGLEVAQIKHEVVAHDERMRETGQRFAADLARVLSVQPVVPAQWTAAHTKLALIAVIVLVIGNLGADSVREGMALVAKLLGWAK